MKKVIVFFPIFLITFICIFSLSFQNAQAAIISPNIVDPCGPDGELCTKNINAIIILPGMMGSELISPLGTKTWINDSIEQDLQFDSINGVFNIIGDLGEFGITLTTLGVLNINHAPDPIETYHPTTTDDPLNGKDYGTLDSYRDIYVNLYNNFHNQATVVLFQYDWRQDITKSASKLEDYIISKGYNHVVLVAHSMGGTVAAKYLSLSAANRDKVAQLNTIGSPLFGTPEALYMIETGNLNYILGIDLPLNLNNVASDYASSVIYHFPSVYEMMHNNEYYQHNPFVDWSLTDFGTPENSIPLDEATYNITLRESYSMDVKAIESFGSVKLFV